MKTISYLLTIIAAVPVMMYGQTDEQETPEKSSGEYSRLRFSLTYGISAVNPQQINERIGTSNHVLNSSAKSIKSLPELGGTITFRPRNTGPVLILRGGYSMVERVFSVSLPQTGTSPTPTGTISGDIVETYSMYPFSFGIGASSEDKIYQIQIELMYALSSIAEEATIRTASGERISYSRSIESTAYGLRIAGNATVPVGDKFGITLELGYRFMTFDDYEDEKAAPMDFLEFPVNGLGGSMGVSFTL